MFDRETRHSIGGLLGDFRKPTPKCVASDAPNRGRGRPSAFSDDALRVATGYSYARRVGTRRGAQDLVYRMFAIATIEHYCEAFPEKAETLEWLLRPRRRHTLLSELGRFGNPRSDASGELRWNSLDVAQLIEAAIEIAETQPSTKEGVALLRKRRHGREASSGKLS